MQSTVRYVGLDVHKDTIVMAVAEAGTQPAEIYATLANDPPAVLARLRKLGPLPSLRVCYEAGPTGYELYRFLSAAGVSCLVVAPSMVPTQNGNRVKTDKRDARRLAHFLRSGDLTSVWVPDEHTEAVRDLSRSRDDAKRAERTARHQLSKFLLRKGCRFAGKSHWTQTHWQWIKRQTFPTRRPIAC
jgi:transposase